MARPALANIPLPYPPLPLTLLPNLLQVARVEHHLNKLIDLGPASERRTIWRRRLRAKAPLHLLRFLCGLLFPASFLLILLPLPVRIIAGLLGGLRFFDWWLVPVLITVGWLLGVLTALIDRLAIHSIMKPLDPPVPPDNPTYPFAWTDSPLVCPRCDSIIRDRTPARGFVACRCGALLVARGGRVGVVSDESS